MVSNVILGGGIGAVLALILNAFGKKVFAETQGDGTTIIFDENKKQIAKFEGEAVPFNFMEWLPKRISGIVVQVKPNKPQLTFENPLKQPIKLLHLAFVPDTNFKTKGIINILVNGVDLIPDTGIGTFTDPQDFSVPIPRGGLTIRRGENVEVFVWTSDGTAVALTVAPLLGAVVS